MAILKDINFLIFKLSAVGNILGRRKSIFSLPLRM